MNFLWLYAVFLKFLVAACFKMGSCAAKCIKEVNAPGVAAVGLSLFRCHFPLPQHFLRTLMECCSELNCFQTLMCVKRCKKGMGLSEPNLNIIIREKYFLSQDDKISCFSDKHN